MAFLSNRVLALLALLLSTASAQIPLSVGDALLDALTSSVPSAEISKKQFQNTATLVPLDSTVDLSNVLDSPLLAPVGLDGRQLFVNVSQEAEAAAVCGENSLKSSDEKQVCVLISAFPGDQLIRCSGWIVDSLHIATTGSCLYREELGGWTESVEIYCNGQIGCQGPVTTSAISAVVTSNWLRAEPGTTNPYNGGILRTAEELPSDGWPWKERIGDYRTNVLAPGYPDEESRTANSPCQRYPEYTGCAQFSSFGVMSGILRGGFFRPLIDTCGSEVGSPLFDTDESAVTGMFAGGEYDPCYNVGVPLRENGVDSGCNGNGGGVGINCLIDVVDSVDVE
jgi:hypothetical protein